MNGSMTNAMARVMNYSAIRTSTWESMTKDRSMGKDSTPGCQEIHMMENGSMESSMDTESGKVFQATATSASGFKTKHTATDSTNGPTVTDMRVNGSSV